MSSKKSKSRLPLGTIIAALIAGAATIIAAIITVNSSGSRENPPLVVTDASLAIADTGLYQSYYNVRCPITVRLEGNIAVTAPGTVSYRFVRILGLNEPERADPVKTVTFDSPGTTQVIDQVTINIPEGEAYTGVILEIIHPVNRRSNQVDITVRCDPTLPEGPPGPPPDVGNPP